jgi:hypothetical protein
MLRAKRDGLPYPPESSQKDLKDKIEVLREKRQTPSCVPQNVTNDYNSSWIYSEKYCHGFTTITFYCKFL